jgi:tripartite-type tricarboxylate transporter receptor subunit TctC
MKALVYVFMTLLILPNFIGSAGAVDYPKGPVTLMVPFTPGGATDTTARAIAKAMEKYLKVPVVCETKEGGGGSVGWMYLSRQKPDGYTIGMATVSIILQQYTGAAGVNVFEFEPISEVAYLDNALSVPANSPYKTLKELIEFAKKNPGKIRAGNSGTGSIWHLCAVGLEEAAGVKFTHVPFKGGKPAAVAMIGGHLEAGSTALGEVTEFVKGSRARILGLPSEERFYLFPDVPTFRESGYNVTMGCFVGLIAPKGTPKEIVKILDSTAKKGVESEDYKTILGDVGNRVRYSNSEDFAKLIKYEDSLYHGYIKKLGLEMKK